MHTIRFRSYPWTYGPMDPGPMDAVAYDSLPEHSLAPWAHGVPQTRIVCTWVPIVSMSHDVHKRKENLSYFSFCLCLIIVLRLLGVELHRDARSPPGIRLLRPSQRSLGTLGYPKRCHGPPPRDPWGVFCYTQGIPGGHRGSRGGPVIIIHPRVPWGVCFGWRESHVKFERLLVDPVLA